MVALNSYDFFVAASPVIYPAGAIVAGVTLFLRSISKRSDDQLDIFELGVFYALIVTLYALFPIASYLIGDLSFSPLADVRLYQAQPSPREIGPIFWYYFLYLAAFAIFYYFVRGSIAGQKLKLLKPTRLTLLALVVSMIAVQVVFLLVNFLYGVTRPQNYYDSYLMYQGLPRVLQQVLNHLSGIALVLDILVGALLVLDIRKYRYWIFGWVFIEIFSTYMGGVGSRTGLFVVLLTFVISYHFTIKKFRVRSVVVMGVIALLSFLVLGVVRNMKAFSSGAGLNPFGYSNEFESIFANAYDVSQLKAEGQTKAVFPQFYFSDLLNLVPQQVLPFKKIDVAYWYAKTFYPDFSDIGGAFAFGTISEAILGFGWPDALWRGAVIGILFGFLHRRFVTKRQTIWSYGFYLWVLVFAYECFRGTTFQLVPRAFYEFFSVFCWIHILRSILALLLTRRTPQVRLAQD